MSCQFVCIIKIVTYIYNMLGFFAAGGMMLVCVMVGMSATLVTT